MRLILVAPKETGNESNCYHRGNADTNGSSVHMFFSICPSVQSPCSTMFLKRWGVEFEPQETLTMSTGILVVTLGWEMLLTFSGRDQGSD